MFPRLAITKQYIFDRGQHEFSPPEAKGMRTLPYTESEMQQAIAMCELYVVAIRMRFPFAIRKCTRSQKKPTSELKEDQSVPIAPQSMVDRT